MARRRRVEEAPVVELDDFEVRWKAARRAYVMVGGSTVGSTAPDDDAWWSGWRRRGAGIGSGDFEALALHYEAAVKRLGPDAVALFDKYLPHVRRVAELNAANGHLSLSARYRARGATGGPPAQSAVGGADGAGGRRTPRTPSAGPINPQEIHS